ncbi:hypothetical protein E3N88_28563 [Mikania micrantha]|uniref:Uncharacterized protein n=1 Tax=Mikania micrantha TaxID=192012 RepID=A0A5N6N2S0_9ASTR|nr:hypothetical protein E3N88_28563 [Mikania micrantha]
MVKIRILASGDEAGSRDKNFNFCMRFHKENLIHCTALPVAYRDEEIDSMREMMNVGENRVRNGVLDCPESKNEEKFLSIELLDSSRYAKARLRVLRESPLYSQLRRYSATSILSAMADQGERYIYQRFPYVVLDDTPSSSAGPDSDPDEASSAASQATPAVPRTPSAPRSPTPPPPSPLPPPAQSASHGHSQPHADIAAEGRHSQSP